MALEQARLSLRAEQSADRARTVREAMAVLLVDPPRRGAESVLVRRFRQEPEE